MDKGMIGKVSDTREPLRILVVLTSHGTSNDHYLFRLIEEYRSMPFDIDIVVLSNLRKQPAPDVEVLVGLPGSNPWSLPFPHKKVFAERLETYDLFVYSEDDMLITETNLRAFLEVTAVLQDDEIAGFIRMEKGSNGSINYPDVHENFHWSPASLRSRGKYTLAHFTNEHAACYVLTQWQLRRAIKSGGFLVEPHEWKYDLLCSAATDPYTQCGFTKLIPISHLDDFTVHHLSNKYAGRVGVDGPELRAQVDAMLRLAENACIPVPLLDTETKLWRGMYSKDYYEPLRKEVISMIPPQTRSVLSIGCGSGATECLLVERGLRVVAVPLDPVICGTAAATGVEMVLGNFQTTSEKLQNERFDCLLCLNVLHLARNPVEVLCLFRGVLSLESAVIIQAPNMLCVPAIWRRIRNHLRYRDLGKYDRTGAHLSSPGEVRAWCRNSGLKLERMVGIVHRRAEVLRGYSAGFAGLFMSPSFVTVARKMEGCGDSLG
jgi:2-polyprenyl-3-methyl-5-hydroxy-6-metoxy-1,4-benzoquinol methylase